MRGSGFGWLARAKRENVAAEAAICFCVFVWQSIRIFRFKAAIWFTM